MSSIVQSFTFLLGSFGNQYKLEFASPQDCSNDKKDGIPCLSCQECCLACAETCNCCGTTSMKSCFDSIFSSR